MNTTLSACKALLRNAVAKTSRLMFSSSIAKAIAERVDRRQPNALTTAMMFYPKIDCDQGLQSFVSGGSGKISRQLAQRLSDAYNFAIRSLPNHGNSFWAENNTRNADVVAALRNGNLDQISTIINNPGQHSLFWGIDGLTRGFTPESSAAPSTLVPHVLLLADGLLRLAEAVGAVPLWYPEHHFDRQGGINIGQTLDAIESKIGMVVDFPNPFPNEFGIRTSRGVASYRTFQSIYQAWRLFCLSKIYGERIVEIGPGLGRTAYYARKFGLSNYTTIDLPLGNIAQASFLSRALGEDEIALPGEQARIGQVRIETPSWYLATDERFDIAFNADSITEIAFDNANAYANKIVATSRAFVSINHEINAFKTADLAALKTVAVQRFPYWMRKGYAEELYLIG